MLIIRRALWVLMHPPLFLARVPDQSQVEAHISQWDISGSDGCGLLGSRGTGSIFQMEFIQPPRGEI